MKNNPLSILPILLLGAALLPALLVQVLADVIASSGESVLDGLGQLLPILLVAGVLLFTAWLVRKLTKKK